jgi:CheY-like chemotaxis protein
MNLKVAKNLMKLFGIVPDLAVSGQEAMERVRRKHYHIVFLDHMMPGMDGIETLYAMKCLKVNQNKNTPVISLTANAIRGAREQYLAAGFQDYLTKPINCTKLEEMVEKYLPSEKVTELDYAALARAQAAEDAVTLPPWLAEIAGLEPEAGVQHCGRESAYLDVLTVFADSIEVTAKEIEGYFQEENWPDYTTKVHALKSTAKIVGALELSERARRLEDAGKEGYIQEIRQDHRPLMELYLSYAEKLQPLLSQET